MIKGIRTPEDYWQEIVSGWPKNANPIHVKGCHDAFLAGVCVCSSIMAEITASTLPAEEKGALYSFLMEEAMRVSGFTFKTPAVRVNHVTGEKTLWEP